MSRDVIAGLREILKLKSATFKKAATTKLGGNTYQNETVIKATALKLALMKATHPYFYSGHICTTETFHRNR